MPPGIGGQLASRGLLRPHQPRCHVGDALDGLDVVGVMSRVFGIPEDVIVLGGPFLFGARAVIVGPNDLVQEALTPEDLVKQHLAVVHFAVIDVKVEAAVGFEHPPGLNETRLDERDKIVEEVAVSLRTQLHRLIACPGKTCAVAGLAAFGANLGALLHMTGVERRIDINKIHRLGRQGGKDG